jgi:hypothetical protein
MHVLQLDDSIRPLCKRWVMVDDHQSASVAQASQGFGQVIFTDCI